MANSLFRTKAPVIMARLLADIPSWKPEDAAADLGNLGQESGGFALLQEQKPTVAGSKGGYGWYQWTGPRRREYFAWCKAKKLDVNSDDANYGFHIFELKGKYKAVIGQVAAAETLADKVHAFERGYERAGVPNYPGRNRWATAALDAWNAAQGKAPAPTKPAVPATTAENGPDAKTIERVQTQLIALGYTEVGGVDGKVGTMTATAIRAFRAENGLPAGDGIDDTLLLALQKAGPRKLAPARTDATPGDVRDKVPEAKTSWLSKMGGYIVGIPAAIGAAIKATLGNIDSAKSYIDPLTSIASDVPGWVWLAGVAGLAGVLVLISRHGEAKSIEAFKTGARR